MRIRILRAATPWLFLIFALASSLYLAWNVPPFLAADELTHFQRSDILTFGPRGEGPAPVTGYRAGWVDTSIGEAARSVAHVMGHPETKVGPTDLRAASSSRFDGRIEQIYQGNARNPLFYLPGAAAVTVGKHQGWPVVSTLNLARSLNAVAAVLIAFFALRMARQAQLPLFAVLSLPMAAALFGSMNQDAQILSFTALGVAILSRAMGEGRPLRSGECVALMATFAMVGMAKLPYALLAVLMWVMPAERRGVKWATALLALAIPLAWTLWLAHDAWTPPERAGVPLDPQTQFQFLVEHPRAAVSIGVATLQASGGAYLAQLVGVLGWLDTPLPPGFYTAAGVVIAFACIAAAAPPGSEAGWRAVRLAAPVVAVASAAGVFAAMYVTWSSVGAPTVEGVQGRYLLPLALVCALLVEGNRSWLDASPARRALQAVLTAAVLAFPLVGLLVTAHAVTLRFYPG